MISPSFEEDREDNNKEDKNEDKNYKDEDKDMRDFLAEPKNDNKNDNKNEPKRDASNQDFKDTLKQNDVAFEDPSSGLKYCTAADLLIAYLKQEGVEYIFGIPGGPLMPLYEAIFKDGTIKPIITKHEQGAAFMADGYARSSGKLGVCCATTGPGATNLVTGVACSYADSIPVLVLTAQNSTLNFGKGAIQESTCYGIDIVEMFKPITKSSVMVQSAEQMGYVIRTSLRQALSGRKGPVHINLPANFMKKKVPFAVTPAECYRMSSQQFDREAIKQVSKHLLNAKNILNF